MHELSIAMSLLDIVKEEMAKHGKEKLVSISVKHGRLSNVVPEALDFAWDGVTRGTEYEGSKMELEEVPLKVACRVCKAEFLPDNDNIFFMPCPKCGEEFGHTVLEGKEIYLDRLTAE